MSKTRRFVGCFRRLGGGAGENILASINEMLMMSFEGFMSEGAMGGGGCTMDGVNSGCGLVSAAIQGGGAVQCTNNNCLNFAAWADGSSGYKSWSAPGGYSLKDIANAQAAVDSANNAKPVDVSTIDPTSKVGIAYQTLLDLGVDANNITIMQTGTDSFTAVLTDAGFDQLASADFDSNLGDSFLHYPYTDGGRSDQDPSLHGVWFDEDLTDYVGGSGVYMEFHTDSSNPYNGGFLQHWGCDVFHITCSSQ
jgi:hypothetical protein